MSTKEKFNYMSFFSNEEMEQGVDVSEDYLNKIGKDLLGILLKDRTTGRNIIWGTSDYVSHGEGFQESDTIEIVNITGADNKLIRPRALKTKVEKELRIQEKAEVFTPSWVCNKQNNLIDKTWFNRRAVFNREKDQEWQTIHKDIIFPKGKTWEDYVNENRLEITCGEAPYLVSRYDTTTGNYIQLTDRIGILDRKIRVINENVPDDDNEKWLDYVQKAFMHTYGYEWQGDSLLLAREALLCSFIDYYRDRYNRMPQLKSMKHIANIISWNIWQMDGLRCVVPETCHKEQPEGTLPGTPDQECEGCREGKMHRHNGTYCKICNWDKWNPETHKKGFVFEFVELFPR